MQQLKMKSGHDIQRTKIISTDSLHIEPNCKSFRYEQIVWGLKSRDKQLNAALVNKYYTVRM